MKIALALALPALAALGCAAQPAAPPTPTPVPGATFHIPPQAPSPTIAPAPSSLASMPKTPEAADAPSQTPPAPNAISPENESSQEQSQAANPDETGIRPSPTPAKQFEPADPVDDPVPVEPAAAAEPGEPQMASGKKLPPRTIAQFKRNPPIGALSSALSQLARDAKKPEADLAILAKSMPISDNESVAVTAYGDFGDDYPALRQSLIDIGADIRNEDESSYIEMYIPVASLIALASLSDNIHRVDPIIPPSTN